MGDTIMAKYWLEGGPVYAVERDERVGPKKVVYCTNASRRRELYGVM
jgi:hypothetical protein